MSKRLGGDIVRVFNKTRKVVNSVKNLLNNNHVKKTIRIGTDIFNVVQPLVEKPTYLSVARAVFGAGRIIIVDAEVWSDDYFSRDHWSTPYSSDFNVTILQVLSKYPFSTMKTADESNLIRLINFDGIKVGWTYNTKLNTTEGLYVETNKLEQAREKINHMLWEQFRDRPLVMRHNKRSSHLDEPKIVFEIDDAFHPLPSAKATEYARYLKRCLEANVPRSVMLYGPPGTGKSTMARTVIENLRLRSFRIRVEDVSGLENSTLFEAINIFKPDAVILDDFDRAHAQASLLETLEFFQRHVKLVVATVNDKNSLDEALLRPGRFDELVMIDHMDEAVIKHLLGEYVDGYEDVKFWPIAFIQEYCKRRKFMDSSEAASSMAELARRVKRLDRYRDPSDAESWDDLLNVKKHDDPDQNTCDDKQDDAEVGEESAPDTQRSSRQQKHSGIFALPMRRLDSVVEFEDLPRFFQKLKSRQRSMQYKRLRLSLKRQLKKSKV